MYVTDYQTVPAEPGGVDGLTVRWVINASQGATNFAMRVLELQPGKLSPMHQHDHEHEVFVINGEGEIETADGRASIKSGAVVFVSNNESHQFRNTGKDVLRFIDVIAFSTFRSK
jgi:quercetin dioxygenase-like cupin family protein